MTAVMYLLFSIQLAMETTDLEFRLMVSMQTKENEKFEQKS